MPIVTVYADPPWSYGDKLRMSSTKRSSVDQYHVMTVPDICKLADDRSIAGYPIADDAFLFLWVTNPMLLDGSGPAVCRAWGFEPKQLLTWVKGRLDGLNGLMPQIGMGRITRGVTEHLIIATRGKPLSLVRDHRVINVFTTPMETGDAFVAPRYEHSQKPGLIYGLIERLVPGPYLELFARRTHPNWEVWGDQLHSDDTLFSSLLEKE